MTKVIPTSNTISHSLLRSKSRATWVMSEFMSLFTNMTVSVAWMIWALEPKYCGYGKLQGESLVPNRSRWIVRLEIGFSSRPRSSMCKELVCPITRQLWAWLDSLECFSSDVSLDPLDVVRIERYGWGCDVRTVNRKALKNYFYFSDALHYFYMDKWLKSTISCQIPNWNSIVKIHFVRTAAMICQTLIAKIQIVGVWIPPAPCK